MRFLIDTDVLIDYLRGIEHSINYLQSIQDHEWCVSVATVSALYAGIKEGKETRILSNFFDAFQIIPITHDVAKQGGLWRRDYGRNHGTGLIDAIIAATSSIQKISLITLNKRHYPMLNDLIVPYQK